MVEAQAPAQSQVQAQLRKHAKKGQSRANEQLWRCGWHCFSCITALLGCCCGTTKCPGTSAIRSSKERALFWIGLVTFVFGISLAAFWQQIIIVIVNHELALSPRSTSFQIWRSTPVPLSIDFYFWNWTNPQEINQPGTRPHFEQMGPYRFKETKEKVNITWNDNNGTISFRQLRRWYFDAENSNGSLSDNVTTINVVALTTSHVVRGWHFLMQRSVSLALQSTKQSIAITRTAGQFLFEGYEDPLITIASKVPVLSGVDIPAFDKFGWFYMRNGSEEYDGHFNMRTGARDMAHLGELAAWNYNNYTPFYEGQCGALRGSAGELWPPGRETADSVSLFAPDLCRSVTLYRAGPMREADIEGVRFEGSTMMLDNGQLDTANECFCDGECVPGGVANVSRCRYGAPAFVSFPHFHLADPSYRGAVSGMRPRADKHSFYIGMEPTYGIPLDVAARFQINLLVQRNKYIFMLSKIPERLMFPVIWFEQRAAITPELALPLRLLLLLPVVLVTTAGVMVLVGVCCSAGVLLAAKRRRHQQRVNTHALVASFVAKTAANGHPSTSPSSPPAGTGPEGASKPLLRRGRGCDLDQSSDGCSSPVPRSPNTGQQQHPREHPEDAKHGEKEPTTRKGREKEPIEPLESPPGPGPGASPLPVKADED